MRGGSWAARIINATLVLGSSLLTGGCAAALVAPSLLTGGGSYAFVKSQQNKALKETSAMTAPYDTAQAIKGNVDQRDVLVTDFTYRKHLASWMAETPRGRYSCWKRDNEMVATCSLSTVK